MPSPAMFVTQKASYWAMFSVPEAVARLWYLRCCLRRRHKAWVAACSHSSSKNYEAQAIRGSFLVARRKLQVGHTASTVILAGGAPAPLAALETKSLNFWCKQSCRQLRVGPNPSLKLTRYGRHCKPGPRHLVHHREPGLQRLPPRAA